MLASKKWAREFERKPDIDEGLGGLDGSGVNRRKEAWFIIVPTSFYAHPVLVRTDTRVFIINSTSVKFNLPSGHLDY